MSDVIDQPFYVLVCVGDECVCLCVVFLIPKGKGGKVKSKHSPAQHLRLQFNMTECDVCVYCLILQACWGWNAVICSEKNFLPIDLL